MLQQQLDRIAKIVDEKDVLKSDIFKYGAADHKISRISY